MESTLKNTVEEKIGIIAELIDCLHYGDPVSNDKWFRDNLIKLREGSYLEVDASPKQERRVCTCKAGLSWLLHRSLYSVDSFNYCPDCGGFLEERDEHLFGIRMPESCKECPLGKLPCLATYNKPSCHAELWRYYFINGEET